VSSVGVAVKPIGADRRIFGAASAVTIAVIAVKLVAVLKEFAVADIYGRSDAYEAFLTAALIPALLVNLISESMSQALIPTFVRVRDQEGQMRAQQLLSNALVCTTTMMVLVSLTAAATARWLFPLIGSHFAASKLDLAVHLFYGLLPVIFLTGLAANCTAILNTTGKYGLPALAPIAVPLTVLLIAPVFTGRAGIWAMVYATIVGALAQLGWVAAMMTRRGYRLTVRWYGMTKTTAEILHQYGPVLLSGVVASGGLLVDQSMAAMLPAGSVAALAYGGRFVSVALGLLGGSVSSAVTPVFCEMVARHDWDGCRQLIRSWAWKAGGLAAVAACVLIASAHLLVRLTFQHGAFGAADSAEVSLVLEMYAIQIPFFVCSRVFYRFLIAMGRADLVLKCGLVNLILDVGLNLLLIRWLGVAGIALATSLWTVSTLGFLGYWTWKVLPPKTDSGRPVRVG
jgi:putative peptidoglycan lipid II flippase